jgi:GH24 family phage-related lysozyme (muramidase)
MLLRQGDTGDVVKTLQRGLNKLGSMLLVDGGFGPETVAAVIDARERLNNPGPPEADDDFQAAVAQVPDLMPALTAAGATFIARAEVASPSAYRQKYQAPCWPSAKSGITIGIGYDCQCHSQAQFQSDWGEVLPAATLEQFLPVLGVVGSADSLAQVKQVAVPLRAAMTVFAKTLLDYLGQTRSIYPQIDTLSAPRRTALVSLVYNRGTRLTDTDTQLQDRLEMRTIRDLLASGRDDDVPNQFDAMARLWADTSPGLVKRRHGEATLWRSGFAALQLD